MAGKDVPSWRWGNETLQCEVAAVSSNMKGIVSLLSCFVIVNLGLKRGIIWEGVRCALPDAVRGCSDVCKVYTKGHKVLNKAITTATNHVHTHRTEQTNTTQVPTKGCRLSKTPRTNGGVSGHFLVLGFEFSSVYQGRDSPTLKKVYNPGTAPLA